MSQLLAPTPARLAPQRSDRTRAPLYLALVGYSAALFACAADTDMSEAAQAPEPTALRASAIVTNPALVISQVYGSGGNTGAVLRNDYVELFNRSTSSVLLTGLSLQYTSAAGTGNFGATATQLVTLPTGASVPAGGYYLVALASGGAVGALLPTADTTGTINMSGTAGKVALVTGVDTLGCNGGSTPCTPTQSDRIIDLVGFGAANYFEGAAPTVAPSTTLAVLRAGNGCTDTNSNGADFSAAAPAPRNSASPLNGPCGGTEQAPNVASTVPANGAVNVAAASALSVTFSEPVNVAGSWFSITCSASGAVSATVSGGPTTFTLAHVPFAAGETCSVTINAASVTDVDAVDPPDAMAADYGFSFTVLQSVQGTPVHTIQGVAHRSSFTGQVVSAGPAIVTAKKSNGFYMQDVTPDASDATSEGIFVFTSSAPTVSVGDLVVVTGTVSEFRPGCSSCSPSDSAFDNLTTTELVSPTLIDVRATGQALPAPVVLGTGAGQRAVPTQVIEDDVMGDVETAGVFDPATDGIDFYESLEAMRVRIESPTVVGPTVDFTSGDREIAVLARADASPRTPRGGIIISSSDYNPERVFLSNNLGQTLPVAVVGDAFNGPLVGVFDYSFANFKLFVSETLPPLVSGGLTPEITSLTKQLPTQLIVGSINVENLDPGDGAAKFSRLASIIVQNLGAPDIVALEEIQDNNGATNDSVVDASVTLNTLVAAIGSAGGPAYQYTQINPVDDQNGGEPGGNIRVAILYRTDRGVQFVARGAATSTTANAVDNSTGTPHLALSPGLLDPTNAVFNSSRKPLAGEFTFAGNTCFVIANHWNSKGGDDPLFGRFQPPVLGSEVQRQGQAEVVAGFIDALLTANPQACAVVIGDLNDFSFSAPITRLKTEGMVDLIETLPAGERYTYVFQGNSQDLDHILVSPGIAPRVSYDIAHVNAEFFDRASDHDPAVMRLEFGNAPVITVSGGPDPVATGSAFSFQITATGSPAPTFSLDSGPAGLAINPSTGLVTWTPTAAGTYDFTVRVQNGVGAATQTFAVTVQAAASVPASSPVTLLLFAIAVLAIGGALQRRSRQLG